MSPCGWSGSAASTATPSCSPLRWRCGGCGRGRSAWTSRPRPAPWRPMRTRSRSSCRGRRTGTSCTTLPLVAVGADAPWRPLRLVDGRLYLDRYWQQEQLVRRELDQRAAQPAPVADLPRLRACFAGAGAGPAAAGDRGGRSRWVSVITGGPGTGKTHTVARLLRLLSTSRARRRGSRWRRRPGRRPPACRSRSGAGRRAGPARWTSPRPRCTGCSAGGRTAAAGFGTTPATGCPTTSSSSTRRRWCR